MSPLRAQLERIRRRGWLVAAVLALAIGATLAASWGDQTTYTAKSTLTIASQNRAPEQDAVLAQGYAEYFNDGSYQGTLRERADVSDAVMFSARTAAASPIVYVEATGLEPEFTAAAAAAMAIAFRDDVNKNLRADRDRAIDELEDQIAAQRAQLVTLRESNPEISLITSTILALQDRIAATQSDTTNQLRDLQLHAGVSSTSPNLIQNLPLAVVGGLILGCAAALGFASFENRLTTAHEIREHLGLETLAVIPSGRSSSDEHTRTERLKQLANIVSLSDLDRPPVIAVTAPKGAASTAWVAEGLAFYRAIQNERVLLIQADLYGAARSDNDGNGRHGNPPGVANFLAGDRAGLAGLLRLGENARLHVMAPGTLSAEPYALFARERFADLVAHAKAVADLIVIQAPPITEAAEAQVVCAAADQTILVIEDSATRVPDAVEACQMLEQVEARILGVVLTGAHGEVPASGDAQSHIAAAEPIPARSASTEPDRVPAPSLPSRLTEPEGVG
jgi:polysaccharide biosynthesis transport protein